MTEENDDIVRRLVQQARGAEDDLVSYAFYDAAFEILRLRRELREGKVCKEETRAEFYKRLLSTVRYT